MGGLAADNAGEGSPEKSFISRKGAKVPRKMGEFRKGKSGAPSPFCHLHYQLFCFRPSPVESGKLFSKKTMLFRLFKVIRGELQ